MSWLWTEKGIFWGKQWNRAIETKRMLVLQMELLKFKIKIFIYGNKENEKWYRETEKWIQNSIQD